MATPPKILILAGASLIAVGVLWHFLRLGHLPGDIAIERPRVNIYFPLMTSLILSLVLTVVLNLLLRFFKR